MVENNPTLQLEIAEILVEALNLDVVAAEIDPEAPLYGEGLGLDSIDILEVALVVSKRYGLQLKSDSAALVSKLAQENIIAGYPLEGNRLLVCATEMTTDADIAALAKALA